LPVVATVAGKIVRANKDGGWGNHIELQGEDGWNRQYAHLSAMNVVVGQQVRPGDVLGKVGTTGSSSAIHLHYGNRRRSTFGSWEYRNPSTDFKDLPKTSPLPTGKLIKSDEKDERAVYIYNGRAKFPIPDWETFIFLFGKAAKIEEVSGDVLSKIPTGEFIPSLA
jgi:murein DD-endopeptidase MepM/ murein hydrolase activator NlpD